MGGDRSHQNQWDERGQHHHRLDARTTSIDGGGGADTLDGGNGSDHYTFDCE